MELKLPFGIKDGKLVEVSQVARGLDCGCVCPACGYRLIARKGDRTVHHFAHHKSAECIGAFETALHIAAKDILERHKKIRIPAVQAYIGVGYGEPIQLYSEQTIQFDKVFLEKRLDDIVPDIVVEVSGKPLLIEIGVTHLIGKEKKKKLEHLNISTLEIDLSKLDRQITLTELEAILIDGIENKQWIHNSKHLAFRKAIEHLGKKHGAEFRVVNRQLSYYVDGCPLRKKVFNGKPCANLIDDCSSCEYFFDFRGNGSSSHTHITCIGHARNEIKKIVSSYKKS